VRGSANSSSGSRREVYLHAWDVHGAKSAGLVGGFISRGQPLASFTSSTETDPSTMLPADFTGRELIDAARILAATS